MPKRSDIKSVLVIGAGPIVIGQACEFDYSGTQACRALREEGVRVILLNSNPATIMTDPEMADATYIEPVDADTAAAIIEKEKPDAVLPTMGGQTALNCAMELNRRGVFEGKDAPILIGANAESIHKAEERSAFKEAMEKIGLKCAPSAVVSELREALAAVDDIGFPVIIRPSFTLGGGGGGIAYNTEEFNALAAKGLAESPTGSILMERSLIGWKEFEMEVVRDKKDNCIIVCSIENVDPMGVHTGDSITVAPAQTLTDKEYQRMRDASIAVMREIGVDTGGSNVQFAVNPENGDMVVIEMNPRVSRSSALASKATGFPIAKVAVKLALGYTLDEIANDITGGKTPASFEPSIDYIVTKIPRFDFAKFSPTKDELTTQMRSVGEVMAIGGTFAESLQKALHGLDMGIGGLDMGFGVYTPRPLSEGVKENERNRLRPYLSTPNSRRILDIADAFRNDMSVDEVHQLTQIDKWFLREIEEIIAADKVMRTLSWMVEDFEGHNIIELEPKHDRVRRMNEYKQRLIGKNLLKWKQLGFSDEYIGWCRSSGFSDRAGHEEGNIQTKIIRERRKSMCKLRQDENIHPVYKRIDTCAGEFPTDTAYFYSTYCYSPDSKECELNPTDNKKIIILGSGPNRIGQGIEFDYCCVHGVMALKEAGFETIMVNCNPETVSTDYDTADRLFFEPLTAENVGEIIRREKEKGEVVGVIVQFGGQTPLNIADELEQMGAPIIGTSVKDIDLAESRERFQQLLKACKLKQPKNAIVKGISVRERNKLENVKNNALQEAKNIGYPLVVRPSYVSGGRNMEIIYDGDRLLSYLDNTLYWVDNRDDTKDILLDKFLDDAIEVDVDAVRDKEGVCIVAGVMEHIERAGVHSGDSACSLPPYSLPAKTVAELKRQTLILAKALNVIGLMNVQFAVMNGDIYVLEVNPRASRTAPFVSKATGLPIAKIAAKAMAGISLQEQGIKEAPTPNYFSVKEAVFPFNKFPNVDVLLGPEMKSTGETMGIGKDFPAAFLLSQDAINPPPRAGTVLFSVRDEDKPEALKIAETFSKQGYALVATKGTAEFFNANGVPTDTVNKVREGRPHILDLIVDGGAQIVINTEGNLAAMREDSFAIRRSSLMHGKICFTTIAGAKALAAGLKDAGSVGSRPQPVTLQCWHKGN